MSTLVLDRNVTKNRHTSEDKNELTTKHGLTKSGKTIHINQLDKV